MSDQGSNLSEPCARYRLLLPRAQLALQPFPDGYQPPASEEAGEEEEEEEEEEGGEAQPEEEEEAAAGAAAEPDPLLPFALDEQLLFPPYVRTWLMGFSGSQHFPEVPPGDVRVSFSVLRTKLQPATLQRLKAGVLSVLRGQPAATPPVQSRLAVRPLDASNPAFPGFGVFSRVRLQKHTALCQYGGVVMLDGEANKRQEQAFARVAGKAAAAAAARAPGAQPDEGQLAQLASEALLTCFYDTPLGQTVIDGAPAGTAVRCTVRFFRFFLPYDCASLRPSAPASTTAATAPGCSRARPTWRCCP